MDLWDSAGLFMSLLVALVQRSFYLTRLNMGQVMGRHTFGHVWLAKTKLVHLQSDQSLLIAWKIHRTYLDCMHSTSKFWLITCQCCAAHLFVMTVHIKKCGQFQPYVKFLVLINQTILIRNAGLEMVFQQSLTFYMHFLWDVWKRGTTRAVWIWFP